MNPRAAIDVAPVGSCAAPRQSRHGYTIKAMERKMSAVIWLEVKVWILAPRRHILIELIGYPNVCHNR